MKSKRLFRLVWFAPFALAGAAVAADDVDARQSYSVVRDLEGRATVSAIASEDRREPEAAERNQPILAGDRVRLEPRSRMEVVLADHSRLRLDGDSELIFSKLAYSADTSDRTTELRLVAGALELAVGDDALGDALPSILLPNAAVYLQEPGTYVVRTDGSSWSQVVARSGYAEIVTDEGSSIVRADEAATIRGESSGRVSIGAASEIDAFERWSDEHTRRAARVSVNYVDPSLSYYASDFDTYGTWVRFEDNWAWRPRVEVGWRPYWQGRWVTTPVGLTWVSREPWGWAPYHYGTWFFDDGAGWLWRPGSVWSPAWVYWYWGADYAGWCPVGFYTHYYHRFYNDVGFRFGIYGYTGGSWGFYSNWTFAPIHSFRERDQITFWRSGDRLRRELGGDMLPRGILTTDTHGLRRRDFDRPQEIQRRFIERPGEHAGEKRANLPDVTDFVGRKTLAPVIRDAVLVPPAERPKLAGTPFSPGIKVEPVKLQHPPVGQRPPTVAAWKPNPGTNTGGATGPAKTGIVTSAPPTIGKGAPGTTGTPPKTGLTSKPAIAPAPPKVEDRQGWKHTEAGSADKSGIPPKSGGAPVVTRTDQKDNAPVRRVVDGVKKTTPVTEPGAPKVIEHSYVPPPGKTTTGKGPTPVTDEKPKGERYVAPPSGNPPKSTPVTGHPPAGTPPPPPPPPPSGASKTGDAGKSTSTPPKSSTSSSSKTTSKPTPPPPPPPQRFHRGGRSNHR